MKGELPKGWILTSLGEIASRLQAGGTPSTKVKAYYENGTINYVKIEDMTNADKYIFHTKIKITKSGLDNSSAWIIPENSLLYSMYASYGIPIINKIKVATNQAIIAFIPPEGLVNLDYVYYYLLSLKPLLKYRIRGTTQENLNANIVANIEIPLPPLAEQQRIVNKIEELFTNLDKGIESLEEVKSKLKVYRQVILKYAMEGKLTEKWRERNKDKLESASVLLDKIKEKKLKIKKFRKHSLIEKSILIKLPEEWTWTELVNIAIKFQSGGTPLTKIDKYYENGTIPFVKIEDITNSKKYLYDTKIKITKEGLNNSSAWIVPENSILYSMYASYGIPTINKIKVATNQAIVGIVPPHNLINVEFIYYYLLYIKPGLKNLIRGTTQENLNAQIVSNIFFSLPPLEEQKEIVNRIEKLFSLADHIEETVNSKLEESKVLRQSILKKAFEGKLVPQDPNDESAELLLEKIKKQRLNKEELVQEKLI
ncbi:MAG: Type-1 restriction enzyme MjaXIP specificity protein [Candidatus Methanofastidiosum methylothiophilum]|uniref:Type-1 restriction enzyme MjaXIP specificity protein n=1 Tax=Candidatus Methanofastidiosum methylothiophilum TaxID=1705564 RepID=A0A150JHX3_9EURY|nr:MAG: Type-1 restriction enzyme MjaXIP specificity protein [Candidatus Methanofastidiosum methylthiophilus]HOE92697.1 restriction endonuclease subunit S [Methanofastidiosum sp.]KYC56494.1 MAG: Type-1 restriction enzyme MjaXIP specificity protein [Candidatus Methanofastidiosum methylthiophilus]KYC57086.1 MAG: Type-1 restriction enzyme MjaXIP specificity protein [Candidatus Methanofastidiosum methylthiophilus]HOR88266.1 restriction endonuclease subunit S [Methanofastidiosum sp.]